MRFLCLLSAIWFWAPGVLQSQSDSIRSVELGLNITQTLAGFFNAGGSRMPTDPYLISLRVVGARNAFRAGANIQLQRSLEFQPIGEREVQDLAFHGRAGWEKRIPAGDRFTLYWGVDGVVRYEEEKVDFGTFGSNNLRLRSSNWGLGGGPVLGIFFHLNPRISLSTESSLYGLYYQGKEEEDLEPTQPSVLKDIKGFELLPAAPNSLYLIVRF